MLTDDWKNLVEAARARAARHGAERVFTFLADDGAEEALSLADLDERARQLAATLQARGLAGERVLLLFQPGLDYVVGFWACLYARAVAVPAYPPDPSQLARTLPRLGGILRDSGARAILTTTPIQQLAESIFEQHFGLQDVGWITTTMLSPAEEWAPPSLTRDDLAFLQYTSGSTGEPKGVMVSHGNLLANATMIAEGMGLDTGMSGVLWLPPYHDMGLIGGVIQPVISRLSMILMSPLGFISRPIRWLSTISRYRLRGSGAPNFALDLCARRIDAKQKTELDLSSWEILFTGAEPVRKESLRRFSEAFRECGFRPEAFYPCYGLAEATVFVAGAERDQAPTVRAFDRERLCQGEVADAGSLSSMELVGVGRPAAGLELRIVDPETQKPCPPDRIGEIWVAGPSVTLGYWGREEETRRTFQASLLGSEEAATCFLRTGDLGFTSDGELFVTGRIKDLVIVNGANFHPQDIEEAVDRAHPAIRFGCTAAFGLERPSGEVLAVVAEVRTDDSSELEQAASAVRSLVNDVVGITPDVIAFIPARTLPKTSSGKVRRRATRAALLDESLPTHAVFDDSKPRPNDVPSPPDTDAGGGRRALIQLGSGAREAELTRMAFEAIRELNGDATGAIEVDTPVAELGLDSVHVVELLAAMEEQCGVVLPMEDLARGVTIRQLVRAVSDELDRDDPAAAGIERGLG